MSVRTRALRLLGLLAASAMLALSAGFAWSVADDYQTRDIVPDGVVLADGVNLSGLPRNDARRLLEGRVASPLLAPVEVVYRGAVVSFDPSDTLFVDIDAMLDAAFDPKSSVTVAERTLMRVAGAKDTVEIEAVLEVDRDRIVEWIRSVASSVDTPSVDATFTIDAGQIVMRASEDGRATDVERTADRIEEALLEGVKRVELVVDAVEPAVSEAGMGKTIVVRISERRLYLYDGMELEKKYGVAVGKARYPTPRGAFEITLKRYRPSWSNPAPNGWGAGMPAYIPPGPSNPLGTRALNLNSPGIRIHGTTKNSSIGSAASHGCMRMHRWDVEDLYERVEIGTTVLIVR